MHGKKQDKFLYLVIITLILTNFYLIYRLRFNSQQIASVDSRYFVLKDIIDSEEYASYLEGQIFPVRGLEEVAISEHNNTSLSDNFDCDFIILTLFSTLGCTVCLNSELRQVENLYQWVKINKLSASIFGIANASSRQSLLRFKRASGFTFPLFIDRQDKISQYFHLKKFPVTLLIDSRSKIILKANHPVKEKLEWSEQFYTYTKKLLKNNFAKKIVKN